MKNIDIYVSEKLVIDSDTKINKVYHERERKTKLNKEDADYIAWVNMMGKVSATTGKSDSGIYIFDKKYDDRYIYFLGTTHNGKLYVSYCVWGKEKNLKVNDKLCLVNSKNQKKLGFTGGSKLIIGICKSTKEDFDKFMEENNYFTDSGVWTDGYGRSRKYTKKWRYYNNYYYELLGIEK